MTTGGAVLVTGAASGIGAATARRLVDAGRKVVLLDRDGEALAALAAELAGACTALTLDVTDNAAVDALPSTIPDDFQPIAALINNAGHDPGGTTRFDQGSAEDWQSAVETNLLGTMRVTRAILPGMVERNAGDIVNVGSIAGLRIVPTMAAYHASKAGVHAFCDALRADLADTAVRVTEIMPGLTKTDLIRRRYRGDQQRADEYYARFQMALDPDDVASTILFALEAPPHAMIAQIVILPQNRW
ncbi:MAG: SDR family oxidoreductase [Gammaproteobacteria bacterium]|nr:SDR family oxidoreductase [Gammaproteobacteria bacterium]